MEPHFRINFAEAIVTERIVQSGGGGGGGGGVGKGGDQFVNVKVSFAPEKKSVKEVDCRHCFIILMIIELPHSPTLFSRPLKKKDAKESNQTSTPVSILFQPN